MAMPGEYEYYAARSGLASGSLSDHQLAFWRNTVGNQRLSLADAELAYLRQLLAVTSGSLADCRYAYYSGVSGLSAGRSVADHRRAFFANPVLPVTAIALVSTRANPVSVAGGGTTILRATLTGGSAASVVDLWAGGTPGGETDSASDFTFIAGSVFEYVLDVSAEAGETYYFVAKVGGVTSNEIMVQIVA